MNNKTKIIRLAAAILSGVLLSLAFPPFSQSDIVWFAFVPLLLVLRGSTPKRGFRLAFLSGAVFWLINLVWLWNLKNNGGPIVLVILGHTFLSAYCALYTGLFGFCVSGIWSIVRRKPKAILVGILAVAVEPLLWIGTEYLRGIILTGFPWNPLAASQYKNLALLSCISTAGVGVLSGLMIAVNAGIASMLFRIWRDVFAPHFVRDEDNTPQENMPVRRRFAIRSAELAIALIAVVICWSNGISSLKVNISKQKSADTLRVAIVHPDSPCIFEREEESVKEANQTLLDFTDLSADAMPDICLWPETSLPGYIPYDKDGFEMVTNAVEMLNGSPLLVGAVELRYRSEARDSDYDIYNSAFLFGRRGGIRALYRKQHLVPFGEYIPLETKIPFLKRMAPAGFSCTAGTDSCIFAIDRNSGESKDFIRFNAATLICFEDAFPYLSRKASKDGADLLTVLANDAWFDGSVESEQHLAQAVLRCAENSRPMVRCTNRGVSAVIDPCGRVLRRIGNGRGSGYAGFAVHEVPIVRNAPLTPYARHGDWLLHIPAAIFAAILFLAALLFN